MHFAGGNLIWSTKVKCHFKYRPILCTNLTYWPTYWSNIWFQYWYWYIPSGSIAELIQHLFQSSWNQRSLPPKSWGTSNPTQIPVKLYLYLYFIFLFSLLSFLPCICMLMQVHTEHSLIVLVFILVLPNNKTTFVSLWLSTEGDHDEVARTFKRIFFGYGCGKPSSENLAFSITAWQLPSEVWIHRFIFLQLFGPQPHNWENPRQQVEL